MTYKGAEYHRNWRKSKTPEQLARWGKDWRRRHPEKILLKNAETRAKQKGLEFSLALADIVLPERCPCCQCFLEIGDGKLHPRSPSLDRLQLDRGYIKGNVWVICHNCNRQKSDLTVARLRELADLIEQEIERQWQPCDW